MAFRLDFSLSDEFSRLEDQARDLFDQGRDVTPMIDDRLRLNVEDARDWVTDIRGDSDSGNGLATDGSGTDGSGTDGYALLLDRLRDFDGRAQVENLNDIAAIAEALPGSLGKPDDTSEVPTSSDAIPRELAALAVPLSAASRIVEALGPTARIVEVQGERFEVAGTYSDPLSGFSAVRLTSLDGGREVYSVDGLQVGSEADAAAAATLGRLQVGSDAFAAMIADAAGTGLGRGSLIVGPSLGGAVAQVAAYETAQLLNGQDAQLTYPVQLVTVDPLGGRDAAEWLNGGSLDPQALALVQALNLRTEGDVISRIGSHIGHTLTLPALDAAGNRVELDAADAHVNAVSLLQVLSSDTLFAEGVLGAPAEISGFARASSDAASDALIALWRAEGNPEEPPTELQVPGRASLDETRTVWSLDADVNGTTDIAVQLAAPMTQAVADVVLVG